MEGARKLGTESGLYLYCIFKNDYCQCQQKGIDGINPTFIRQYQELMVLVSEVSLSEYDDKILQDKVKNPNWIHEHAKRHDLIIRSVMQCTPVIPVRFGSICKNEHKLGQILTEGYQNFNDFLIYSRGKAEWGVKVFVKNNASLANKNNAAIQVQDNIIEPSSIGSGSGSGSAYLLRKQKEKSMLVQQHEGFNRFAEEVYNKLLDVADEGKKNRLLGKAVSGNNLNMLLNAVFLLNGENLELFKLTVDKLEKYYCETGLIFHISGPWAPYNFCPCLGGMKND